MSMGKSAPKTKRRRRPGRRKKRGRSRSRFSGRRLALVCSSLFVVAGLIWILWPYYRLAGHFESGSGAEVSRVYGRAPVLARGALAPGGDLSALLLRLGYRPGADSRPLPGAFRTLKDGVEVHLRSIPSAGGWIRPRFVEVTLSGQRVRRLLVDGEEAPAVPLDPPLLAGFYDDDLEDRRVVALTAMPQHLVRAVLAAEDATFFDHPGISLVGVVRAAVTNLRRGGVSQGGSTITQQLVKNLYLSSERTWTRKFREGFLALLVEMRHQKPAILEAYLNGIYWGRSGRVNLIGVGSAARAYFGRDAAELDLAEAALLAGMIRSPGSLDPRGNPEAARSRRDEVLRNMRDLDWVSDQDLADALAAPLVVRPVDPGLRYRGYFVDAVAREAKDSFGVDVRSGGHVLVATLAPGAQVAAEEAVVDGLARLEEGGADGGLQGILLSVEPETGAVLAYVGGRDYSVSQFDRIRQGRRQPGSAFKPVIFAAAFLSGIATPATLIEDAPISLSSGGENWRPQNSDRRFRGWVTARQALEQSINVPTVRLGEDLGWDQVVAMARALGIASRLEPLPSLALGAFEVTPAELATVFATFAQGGQRPQVHLVEGVLRQDGVAIDRRRPLTTSRILPPEIAYLVNYQLQGVLERGTGRSARSLAISEPLAGKTGTTNGGRDNWFAGYSPDRATLVWVGYDDNSPSSLSGARAALPIWARFTDETRPPGGYGEFRAPPGIRFVSVDPQSGGRITDLCTEGLSEAFPADAAPTESCYLHGGSSKRASPHTAEEPKPRRQRKSWWKRIFSPRRRSE